MRSLGLVLMMATACASAGRERPPDESQRAGVEDFERFVAYGTEPFWSLHVTPHRAELYVVSTETTVEYPLVEVESAAGRHYRVAGLWRLTTASGDETILVRRSAEAGCSDGMSDQPGEWVALVLTATMLLEGCARPWRPTDG